MNRHEVNVSTSDDANSSSLNTSLNEEEFAIESSNLASGGLRLTISCRRKSFENEVDNVGIDSTLLPSNNSCNTDKHLTEMEDQEFCSVEGSHPVDRNRSEEEHVVSQNSCVDETSGNKVYGSDASLDVCLQGGSVTSNAPPNGCFSKQDDEAHISGRDHEMSNVISPNKSAEENCEDSGPSSSESTKAGEELKPLKKNSLNNNGGSVCANDMHDPLLRLDTLPNVSPDSGIISLDESPFGNESPNSAANGELLSELQHTIQPPSVDCVQLSAQKKDSANTSVCTSQCDFPFKANIESECVNNNNSTQGSDKCEDISTVALIAEHVAELEKDVIKSHGNIEEHQSAVMVSDNEAEVTKVISPIRDVGLILSSPHKISQTTGRKKRGRPPKKKKTLLLKHKKSTLYSSSYGSTPVSSDTDKQHLLLGKRNDEANTNGSNVKGAVDVKLERQACRKKRNHLFKIDDKCNQSNTPVMLKRSPGRPKGSSSKEVHSVTSGRSKAANVISETANDQPLSAVTKIKRPRGRPRKTPLPVESIVKSTAVKSIRTGVKRKYGKRKFFTPRKRKRVINQTAESPHSSSKTNSIKSHDKLKGSAAGNRQFYSLKVPFSSMSDDISPEKLKKSDRCSEKSDFNDGDLDALLKKVKSSISSQFTFEEESSDIIPSLSYDNPFTRIAQPQMFPKVVQSEPPKAIKPKAKKPKLHVMMRRTKRRKRRKVPLTKTGASEPENPNKRIGMFHSIAPQRRFGKFASAPPQKSTGMFGTMSSQKRLSFFTSCVHQPSKILASSRLNVFRSGTGVDNQQPITDMEQSDSSDRKWKRKHQRLLYRKTKHKNIVDPVFAADLEIMINGLGDMAVSENPSDTFIRVRPGEMPLPSIFRVIKIDVNRKLKDKGFLSEPVGLDKSKPLKPRKEMPWMCEMPTTAKPIGRGGRKKSSSDQTVEHPGSVSLSDRSDQWLPPKKRHHLVPVETSQSCHANDLSVTNVPIVQKEDLTTAMKRKGRRTKKTGQEENKTADNLPRSLGQQFVGQELTIDTTSYTTGGSSNCTPSPASCPSRLSTRSSTLPSLSSPSPTGSTGTSRRSHMKNTFPLSCPVHSLSSTVENQLSCSECQLLENSASPGVLRSGTPSQRSSSTQFNIKSSFCSEPLASSSESSLISKTSPQVVTAKLLPRTSRKRRKSLNIPVYDSDSSPPRLEKNLSLSPTLYQDSDVYSEPPEITSSPSKTNAFPRRLPANRCSAETNKALRNVDGVSPRRILRPSSFTPKSGSTYFSRNRQTNNGSSCGNLSIKSTNVLSSHPEFEPLPLDQCRKKKLVEEIRAATTFDSSESSSSNDEGEDSYHPSRPSPTSSGQPPRKRFQRVGLFSDFYKYNDTRKRCENMVRCRDKVVYVKTEHEFGLMPQPVNIGDFYMKQVQNFQLPYDIWWQHKNQQLPKKAEPKIKFRNIRTNVYSDSKVSNRKLEIPLCNCKPPAPGNMGCLDDCLNRMIYTECSPSTCPLGESCGNQKIQKHEWVPGLEKFSTKDRGLGVRTSEPIKSGAFILEYLGEVVSENELRRRMMEEYTEERHHYALHLDSGSVIDGYRMGNIGRYVNHSCQPNCEMQKWNVSGLYRMVLFALRDIEPNEELSYDYNFDPFNQETQQECRCGSAECRGVIGGKTQRSNSGSNKQEKALEDSKDKRKNKVMNKKNKDKTIENVSVQPMAKPLTLKERGYARKHRTFLVRNVDKVRYQRHPCQELHMIAKEELNALDSGSINSLAPDAMLAHLIERSVKTRLAAYTKDTPEMARRHHLAQIFDKMLTELLSLKDEDGDSVVIPLMSLPPRKKQPQYYQVVREPIDMSMIKQRVKTGFYNHLSTFDADIMLLFHNVELYCGPKSDLGQVILRLRRVFNCVKQDVAVQIDGLLGPNTTKSFMDAELEKIENSLSKVSQEPVEDIIRCICGVSRDEGLMLQCEKCLRWQHCDCVQASGKEEHYLCDRCEPRYYDPEILLVPSPADAMPECSHYMTLLKDDVQYAVGDCVYVMRDCKRTAAGTPLRSSHRLMASVNPDKLDIFRIEQLWKDPKGERFASGTPYLRPQETFHEPTRKFYNNELFRTPNFEIIPMDLIMGKCVVMDPNTFCKGRPKGVKEQDVYICEYRVDKTAHLFHKIHKIWYPINTGTFCFDWFETKLNIKRTFSPHEVPEEYKRKAERSAATIVPAKSELIKVEDKQDGKKVKNQALMQSKVKVDDLIKNDIKLKAEVKVNVKKGGIHKTEVEAGGVDKKTVMLKVLEDQTKRKKKRLDKILTRLLQCVPSKHRIDLTYLLEDGKRVRKKLIK